MLNTVETFKEKLRASLSEPNSSTDNRKKFGRVDDKIYEHSTGILKAKSFGNNTKSDSAPSDNNKRSRWIRDKIFQATKIAKSREQINQALSLDKSDSGFQDQEPCGTVLVEENELCRRPSFKHKSHSSDYPLSYKHRWKHRGNNTAYRRNTLAKLGIPIIENEEGETEAEPEQLSVHDYFNNPVTPSTPPTEPQQRTPRLRRHFKRKSPVRSECSISSDSEGEQIPTQSGASNMLNSSDSIGSHRKQSIFFTSHGVWSQDSVIESFRELSPSIISVLECAWNGQASTLEELLRSEEHLNSINCRDGKGRTPLHLAAAAGHAHVLELLLQKGAEVDPCDTFEKSTPLMCAAASGSLACVELLLEAGANVNSGFEIGKTPLHWAVQTGAYECAKKLLVSGAKQNPPIIFSENPLHVAASTGDASCLQLLLDHGADVLLCRGQSRSTSLHIAAEEGNPKCIKLLLEYGAPCEAQDARGQTPLHVAASVDAESTCMLLDSGANPNARDRDGRTPLHCAINRGSRACECLRVLLETSADINSQDNFGFTPLHLAAVNETSQCVSILLRNGADVTIKTKAGTTALTLLVRKIPDVMRFLVERLDAAVTIHDHEPGDPDCEIKLDFRAVVPNSERTFRGNSKQPERTYYQKPRKETDFLTCVLATGNKKILSHPLSEAFLTLKWQRVRKFFWASLLFQIALVLLFSVYVIDVYLIKCPANPDNSIDFGNLTFIKAPNGTFITKPRLPKIPKKPDKVSERTDRNARSTFSVFSFNPSSANTKPRRRPPNLIKKGNSNDEFSSIQIGTRHLFSSPSRSSNQANSREESELTIDTIGDEADALMNYRYKCHSTESWLTVIWCLLLAFTAAMAIKETFQILQAPISYVTSSENWGQWLLIASVLIASWPKGWPFPDRESWQYPAAAIGIWIGWGLMLLQVGRFPALGLYVQMLGKVAKNFGLVILGYACLLIAFALAFCVIFPGEPAYYSIPLAILKVLTMMVGEVDYEDLFYGDDELLYPITAHILHAAFVVIITIVLMNLLVGLAVSDIQGLQKGAKLNRLSRQTALIQRLESFIFSKKLQVVLPRSIGLILQRSALLIPSSYNWFYYFRPNDPRDKRVSKELKLASLRVASSKHPSRHAIHKNQPQLEMVQMATPKQHFTVVSNISNDTTIRRLEQKIETLQSQMEQILQNLSTNMDQMKDFMKSQQQQ